MTTESGELHRLDDEQWERVSDQIDSLSHELGLNADQSTIQNPADVSQHAGNSIGAVLQASLQRQSLKSFDTFCGSFTVDMVALGTAVGNQVALFTDLAQNASTPGAFQLSRYIAANFLGSYWLARSSMDDIRYTTKPQVASTGGLLDRKNIIQTLLLADAFCSAATYSCSQSPLVGASDLPAMLAFFYASLITHGYRDLRYLYQHFITRNGKQKHQFAQALRALSTQIVREPTLPLPLLQVFNLGQRRCQDSHQILRTLSNYLMQQPEQPLQHPRKVTDEIARVAIALISLGLTAPANFLFFDTISKQLSSRIFQNLLLSQFITIPLTAGAMNLFARALYSNLSYYAWDVPAALVRKLPLPRSTAMQIAPIPTTIAKIALYIMVAGTPWFGFSRARLNGFAVTSATAFFMHYGDKMIDHLVQMAVKKLGSVNSTHKVRWHQALTEAADIIDHQMSPKEFHAAAQKLSQDYPVFFQRACNTQEPASQRDERVNDESDETRELIGRDPDTPTGNYYANTITSLRNGGFCCN